METEREFSCGLKCFFGTKEESLSSVIFRFVYLPGEIFNGGESWSLGNFVDLVARRLCLGLVGYNKVFLVDVVIYMFTLLQKTRLEQRIFQVEIHANSGVCVFHITFLIEREGTACGIFLYMASETVERVRKAYSTESQTQMLVRKVDSAKCIEKAR